MSSSDTSLIQAWNSEALETEVEYDLEVEVWSNASEQEDNKDMNQKMSTHQVAPIHELLLAVLLL